jgi:hypothetical protein
VYPPLSPASKKLPEGKKVKKGAGEKRCQPTFKEKSCEKKGKEKRCKAKKAKKVHADFLVEKGACRLSAVLEHAKLKCLFLFGGMLAGNFWP